MKFFFVGVTSDSTITDNAVVRGDGGNRGVQSSGVLIDDSDNITGINDATIGGNLTTTPSSVTNITAGGGITATNTVMNIQGNGGPIDITANPQIAAGADGQLLILRGSDDTNTVTLEDGTGLNLHGKATMFNHDALVVSYDNNDSTWEEVSRNFQGSEKVWSFSSPGGGSGTFYIGGYYLFSGTNNDFSAPQTLGTANGSYAAHVFCVLGADTVDTVTITVTGTSITDAGVRTGSDTDTIVFTHPALTDAYVETGKKFIGQVSIALTSGTAKTCNWGFSKYWDSNNNNFRLEGFEATFRAGATDANADICLIHHKATGWTYNAGAAPTPPTAIAKMSTDHVTERSTINNQNGAWKRDNLSNTIAGGDSEGTIIQIVTGANNTFENGNFMLRVRPA